MSMADRIAVFNLGKIMQVGTPEEIYLKPASRFVADFVGSSNVLPPDFVGMLTGMPGWASLRPEAVTVTAGAGANLTGTIISRGYLGATTRLTIDLAGQPIHAVVSSGTTVPTEGAQVAVSFDPAALHRMNDAP